MAETKHQLEPTTFPAKCKPNLNFEDNPQKTLKFQPPLDNSTIVSQEKNPILEAPERYSSAPDDKDIKFEADSLVEAEDDGDDDFEDDDEEVENDRREAEVDRKGKGIVRDDKGKGKLKVEEEDADDDEDEDDDSDSGIDISNSESDLSDNPLAEVDLDNILPSRTRRRTVQHGVYVANDIGNNDDDSNDSDA